MTFWDTPLEQEMDEQAIATTVQIEVARLPPDREQAIRRELAGMPVRAAAAAAGVPHTTEQDRRKAAHSRLRPPLKGLQHDRDEREALQELLPLPATCAIGKEHVIKRGRRRSIGVSEGLPTQSRKELFKTHLAALPPDEVTRIENAKKESAVTHAMYRATEEATYSDQMKLADGRSLPLRGTPCIRLDTNGTAEGGHIPKAGTAKHRYDARANDVFSSGGFNVYGSLRHAAACKRPERSSYREKAGPEWEKYHKRGDEQGQQDVLQTLRDLDNARQQDARPAIEKKNAEREKANRRKAKRETARR